MPTNLSNRNSLGGQGIVSLFTYFTDKALPTLQDQRSHYLINGLAILTTNLKNSLDCERTTPTKALLN